MKGKRGLRALLTAADVDAGAEFYAELRGDMSISVIGCRGIAEYGDSRIVLRYCSGLISVSGNGLICDSYVNGAVIISGEITSVEIARARRAG